jgi:sodium-dependent phosphate transporter
LKLRKYRTGHNVTNEKVRLYSCEFGGAALLGSRVSGTIRSGIAPPAPFVNHDDIYMFGMMCAVIVVTTWVFFATYIEIPVSITHSIVGAIIGFALCSTAGSGSIDTTVLGTIIGSWFVSPALSAVVSFTLFTVVRTLVLRHDDAFYRMLLFFPFIVFITLWVNIVFIIFKGGIASVSSGKGSGLASGSQITTGVGFGIATGVSFGVALISGVITYIWMKRNIGNLSDAQVRELAEDKGNIVVGDDDAEKNEPVKEGDKAETGSTESEKKYSFIDRLFHQPDVDRAAKANSKVVTIQTSAEVFPVRVELAFAYLQIFTACFASFAHGSNDVANSVGPLSGIVAVYNGGPGTMAVAAANKGNVTTPDWVLFVGCTGLVVGLSLYGHKIIAGEFAVRMGLLANVWN